MYDIELRDITVNYDNVEALKNVNLKIEKKDFLGILGPNGGGKTTLLKVILGLQKDFKGELIIGEHVSIGYVPQFSMFNKNFPINVGDVVLMGRMNNKMSPFFKYKKRDIEIAEEVMKQLHIYDIRNRQISKLSGGQVQKVLIGRALTKEANCLVLDEPTASLDAESKSEIYSLLKEINKNTTIITVSHDIGVVSSYVKNISCLNQKLFYHGNPEDIGNSIEEAYGCPIDLIGHGHPHRVYAYHQEVSDD